MANIPIMNNLAGFIPNTSRPEMTLVELGLMAYDVGLSTPGFCNKIREVINSDAVYDRETDRIVSFQLRLYCEDEDEPFVDDYMILNLAFIGFLTKLAILEDKTLTDKFVEFIMAGIEGDR